MECNLYFFNLFSQLGNPTKRRSYDSVDPMFDDSLPSQSEINKNFYETFSKYFRLNARWSEKKNVPEIGELSQWLFTR